MKLIFWLPAASAVLTAGVGCCHVPACSLRTGANAHCAPHCAVQPAPHHVIVEPHGLWSTYCFEGHPRLHGFADPGPGDAMQALPYGMAPIASAMPTFIEDAKPLRQAPAPDQDAPELLMEDLPPAPNPPVVTSEPDATEDDLPPPAPPMPEPSRVEPPAQPMPPDPGPELPEAPAAEPSAEAAPSASDAPAPPEVTPPATDSAPSLTPPRNELPAAGQEPSRGAMSQLRFVDGIKTTKMRW